MGKRKQAAPRKAHHGMSTGALDFQEPPSSKRRHSSEAVQEKKQQEEILHSVELDGIEDVEIAEFNLLDDTFAHSKVKVTGSEKVALRFVKISMPGVCNFKVGDLHVELLDSTDSVMFSGRFDGDEALKSSLVYLVRKQFIGLRNSGSLERMRAFITQKMLQACEVEPSHTLRKHVRRLFIFLRPEVSMDTFYGLNGEDEEPPPQKFFDPSRLYEAVKRTRDEPCLDIETDVLIAELRPYQKQAAYWMVQRELSSSRQRPLWISMDSLDKQRLIHYNVLSGKLSTTNIDFCSEVSGGILADEMGLGKTLELLACMLSNRFQGSVSLDEVKESLNEKLKQRKKERIDCVCGTEDTDGIMIQCDTCDAWQHVTCIGYEPGKRIGKSKKSRMWENETELVWDDNKSFVCGCCTELISSVEVGVDCAATLIVCPTPILKQWEEEILRHTRKGALKVLVYEGVGRGCFDSGDETWIKEVGAHHLAAADIVIASYDVLRSDIFHDTDDNSRSMRFQKRYQNIATPLTKLKWWRVCLDEAQMVENQTASFTDMAMRLNARHKWCITGTPIQRGLNDLYSLLKFLGAEPFNNRFWWTHAIRIPYEQGKPEALEYTHSFLREIMWRSTKSQVIDQLNIPSQEEKVSWLKFSRLEAHFYRRQHEQCAKRAREVVENSSTALDLMKPLLSLRQACCHPQIGSSGIRAVQGSPMPMEEILEILVDKTKAEGEEAQRAVIFSLNGLAGLAVLENDISRAISLYREALSMGEENVAYFRVDPLQKYHILYNLADLLKQAEGVPRTLRDDMLLDQCEEIRKRHLSPYFAKLKDAQHDFYVGNKKASNFSSRRGNWWLDALSMLWTSKDRGQELLQQLKQTLLARSSTRNASSLALRFRDVNGLKLILQQEFDAISKNRKALVGRLIELDCKMDDPPFDYVKRAGLCGECQEHDFGITCPSCEIGKLVQDYESRILLLKSTATTKDGIVTVEDALRALAKTRKRSSSASSAAVYNLPSETEVILSMLLAHVKGSYSDEWVDGAKKELQYLEVLREECNLAKGLYKAQQALLGALSEVYMHSLRMALEGTTEYELETMSVSPEEIPAKNVELTASNFTAAAELSRVKGHYRYLKGLVQAQGSKGMDDSGTDTSIAKEDCPICHDKVGSRAMVFPCGHLLCCGCMALLEKKCVGVAGLRRVACPTCRARTYLEDVAMAKTGADANTEKPEVAVNNSDNMDDEENRINVAGSYGTKIQSVVRRILALKEKEPLAKILIFSTWQDVLQVLEHALNANQVTSARAKGGRKVSDAISKFKHTNVQVLLLPIQHGANGLNLVEAQHVMLVEPLLNPAAEAQAINRVHRIGQHFKTLVHRFIVRDTVEESIYKLSQKKSSLLPMKQKEQPLTKEELSDLFSLESNANPENELRTLPPAKAAALAAQARLVQNTKQV